MGILLKITRFYIETKYKSTRIPFKTELKNEQNREPRSSKRRSLPPPKQENGTATTQTEQLNIGA